MKIPSAAVGFSHWEMCVCYFSSQESLLTNFVMGREHLTCRTHTLTFVRKHKHACTYTQTHVQSANTQSTECVVTFSCDPQQGQRETNLSNRYCHLAAGHMCESSNCSSNVQLVMYHNFTGPYVIPHL